ncbi:hypothetical protein ACPEEZ_00865 [Frigoribacterium sp. 2-23]|uniref:hypothetical protein n=1 Tax=Frigoribacterium sp. 2-23 TaxID=3415006 RepID=UPI003C6F7F6D
MTRISTRGATWGAVACLVVALVAVGLRRSETIGDAIAIPVVAVFVLGFVALTIVTGLRRSRRQP